MDIIYVGTLPPHRGGSAISGFQLIKAMTVNGATIRAIGPVTRDTIDIAKDFEAIHPEIEFHRFEVPYYRISPDSPATDPYWTAENKALKVCLQRVLMQRSPQLILLGRETFSWHLPEASASGSIPCVLRVAGGTMTGIQNGAYLDNIKTRLLKQFRRVQAVIVPAQHLVGTMRKYGCQKVTYIPNALDVGKFSPGLKSTGLLQALKIESSQTVVMHISNLKPIKRTMDFIDAAKQASICNPGLVFVVLGDGPARSEMEQKCRDLGVQEKFRFLGWIEYNRMPDYIRLSDIIVMCSEAEGLSRVYLEAQSCERVLISSDIAAAREVVTHGRDGLLFATGDHTALTERMLEVAADMKLRRELGRRARARVLISHNIEAAAGAYSRTLNKIINLAPRASVTER